MSNEQIYLYRRKGLSDYATCDRARYVELSQHKLFETMVCYASPEPEEGDHEGRQLEWERAENKRLRADLGECKGEYDRAVNKVDALRDQLASLGSYNYQLNAQYERMCESHLSAEKRNAEQQKLLYMAKELLSTISLHKTMAPADWCDSFKNEVADRLEKLRDAIKPAEPANKERAQ